MSNIIPNQPPDSSLAARINDLHHLAEKSARQAIEHARQAGDLLIEAKQHCPHGSWAGWLAEHFHGSSRTAQAYMRLARGWAAIEAKAQSSADLTIDAALDLIATPKELPAPVPVTTIDMPPMRPGKKYFAAGDNDDMLELVPYNDPAYTYVVHFRDINTDAAEVVYTQRGVINTFLPHALRLNNFRPVTPWKEEDHDGTPPWCVTAPGKPGRVHRGAM